MLRSKSKGPLGVLVGLQTLLTRSTEKFGVLVFSTRKRIACMLRDFSGFPRVVENGVSDALFGPRVQENALMRCSESFVTNHGGKGQVWSTTTDMVKFLRVLLTVANF